MINSIITILLICALPILIMKFRNGRFISLLGTVGAAYFFGLSYSVLTFLLKKAGVDITVNTDICEYLSYGAIALAIPLYLFGTDFAAVKKLSVKTLTAFLLLTVSVVSVSSAAGIITKDFLPESFKLAGMSAGLYTGGTPNLNAIGAALNMDFDLISVSNLSDILIGGLFYVFLLFACKPLFKKFLPAKNVDTDITELNQANNVDDFSSVKTNKGAVIKSLAVSLVIAAAGAAAGIGIWYIKGMQDGTLTSFLVPAIMITATVLGIAGSFIKPLNRASGNSFVAHYLLVVFSFALSSSINPERFSGVALNIFLFFTGVTVASFIVHFILCKIFGIDIDSAMITLTAGVYGPAFVPAIAKQINNKPLTSAGLICGSLGYAIGTFLGLIEAKILMMIF